MSAIIPSMSDLMLTVEQIYSNTHELRIHTTLICGIDDSAGKCEESFDDMEQLYLWHFKQQEILDERRKEGYKQQGYIKY